MVSDKNEHDDSAQRLSIELFPSRPSHRPEEVPIEGIPYRGFGSTLSSWLETAFQVRPEEQRKVLLMLLYGTCIIASGFIVGRTAATSLFLKRIDPTYLPLTYVGTSGIVSIATFLYTRVAQNRRLDRTIVVTMGGLALCTAGFRVLLEVFASSFVVMGSLFVFVELAATLSMVQFWTLANDSFTAREGKRLFPLIGAGGPIASILFGALVRSTADTLGTPNLLVIMTGLFLCCMLIVTRLAGTLPTRPPDKKPRGRARTGDVAPDGWRSSWQRSSRPVIWSRSPPSFWSCRWWS